MKQMKRQLLIKLQPRLSNLGLGNVASFRSFNDHSIVANEYNTPTRVSVT